ncbi:MAG: TldD/PmbA family protein [Candidatus Bathyarchaeota archaeon]|nr:MAG: TldD/PmbA family protein [Candidatus Bathyarchaeota archaeon]
MDRDVVEHALEHAMGYDVEYAEARAHSAVSEQIILRNGALEAYGQSVDSGFNIRVLAEGGLGFSSTNRWTMEEAEAVAETAYRLARASGRRTKLEFSEMESNEADWRVGEKAKIRDVTPESKIALLGGIDKEVASCGVDVPSRMIQCFPAQIEKYFVNSEGSRIASYLPRLACFILITVKEGAKTEQAGRQFGYSGGWEAFDLWNVPEELVHESQVLQRLMRKGKPLKPGKTTLVCGTEVVGIAAHESCGHPMEADRILGREMAQAGRSFIYQGGLYWLGSRIGSDLVTIVDDPRVENSYGFYEYDDEGVKARPRYLYKEGVINEFFHNRETAAMMGIDSNGSARATNYDREAIVRMANTYLLPGDMTEEELLEDVKEGLYMRSFTEWNIDDRRFNQRYVGRESYLIEDGELGSPVSKPTIELTTKSFWSAVDGVTKDLRFDAATCGKSDPMQGIPVYTGGPIIRLREVYMK